ncbi:DUF4124 domain-containing protein [Methylotenera versatilis]|uniref:DUF4124 domain-containing protein n=1 Tax=Methylotenera versatilis (strain 301) TaxID=666681 RepID=D7DHI6_METV0|nr:DUF4124 domain-containing protein [Methylotenera versatilis]ADI29521.1 conserved hypothetical protein [Methylotenera versatilis 301]
MRLRILLLCVVLLPTLASAEIYKWKDKDGVVRYSDVPPPSNVKQEPLYGKKIAKPTGLAPLAPVEGDMTAAINRDKAATSAKDKAQNDKEITDKTKADGKAANAKAKDEKAPLSKEEAAQKRAQDAEKQKQADEQKKAELEIKQANCTGAKQNLATYANGGRIAKTDENGKKQYLGDADIAQGKADAQRDVEKYCD